MKNFEEQLADCPPGVILFRLPNAKRLPGHWCAAMAADGEITQADGSMIREEFSLSFQSPIAAEAREGLLQLIEAG